MSKDEGYSEPLDVWATGADEISCNEQLITNNSGNKKGKYSAFGDTVVSSGRAEWDLQINLESFGGICIGVFKHSKLTKKDDLTELPCNENFAKTSLGWGYTNKTGATIHEGERKKYGKRYKVNDILTMSLDLLAGTLTYSINGESQGLAYDIPRGAYRLACTLPFKEQQVTIKRFWTSLPRSNENNNNNDTTNGAETNDTNDTTNETDDNENNVDLESKENEVNGVSTITIENNDDIDDNNTDENYDFDKNDQSPTAEESREVSKSLKKMAKSQSLEPVGIETDESESLEMIGGGVSRVRGGSLSASASTSTDDTKTSDGSSTDETKKTNSNGKGNKTGKNGKGKVKAPEPINVPVKEDEESSDYFSVSGSNLSTEKANILSCIREAKNVPHTGYGAQLVTHGRTEWILKVLNGHHIIIGVSGTMSNTDSLFCKNQFGFGYCDDGNIYCKDGTIEYNNGFKSGDIVGVHLDMDNGELRFSVNSIDQGPAFNGLNEYLKNSKNDENTIDGYRLAVSLQFRPHSIQLNESTSWTTKRVSPRPGITTDYPDWSFTVPHQRKHSWMSQSKKNKNNSDEKEDFDNDNDIIETSISLDSADLDLNGNSTNSSSSSKTPKKGSNSLLDVNKGGSTSSKKSPKGDKSTKPKRPKSARKAPKSPRTGGGNGKNGKNDSTLQPSQYRKNGVGNIDENVNWTLRVGSTDIFERSGSKLEVTANKNSVSAKHDIKDGNSAIGKLIVSNNMKVQWDIHIDQGSRVTVGIINMDGKSQTAMRKLLNSFFTNDLYGYGYFGNDGGIARNGRFKKYGDLYKRGDNISVILDLFNKTLSFLKNGEDQGIAFKNIPFGEYRIAITIPRNRHKITLTKVQIWDANPINSNTNNDTNANANTNADNDANASV